MTDRNPRITAAPIIALALLIFVAIVSPGCFSATLTEKWFTKLDVHIEKTQSGLTDVLPLKFDDGGNDEVLLSEPGIGFHIYRHNLHDFVGSYRNEHLIRAMPICVAGESLPQVLCKTKDEKNWYFLLVNPRQYLENASALHSVDTIFTEPVVSIRGENQGALDLYAAVDANRDGYVDFGGFRVSGGITLQPRGVVMIDGKTKREMWHRYFGPWPMYLELKDVNGDGEQEIVLIGASVNDGSEAEGIADSQSYVLVLSQSGQFVWPPVCVGGPYSYPKYQFSADSDGRDTNIVVAEVSHSQSDSAKSILIVSGKDGRVLHRQSHPGGLTSIFSASPRAIPGAVLIASTLSGTVVVYDSSLTLRRELRSPKGVERLFESADFDGDNIDEYPLVTQDNTFQLLDTELNSVFARPLAGQVAGIMPFRTTDKNIRQFFLYVGRPYVLTFLRVNKSFAEIVPPVAQISIFVASIAIIVIVLLQSRHRRRYFNFLDSVFNDNSRAILAIDRNGIIFKTNRHFENLFGGGGSFVGKKYEIMKNESSLQTVYEDLKSFLEKRLVHFETNIVLQTDSHPREFSLYLGRLTRTRKGDNADSIAIIQDITELSQAKMYSAWSILATGLAHDLKKPLTPLKLILQDLKVKIDQEKVTPEYARNKYIDPAVVQIDRMARYIDKLSAVARSSDAPREQLDLSQLLTCLVKMQFPLSNECVGVTLILKDKLPRIAGNRDDLERVFCELIDNAANALKGRPDPAIVLEATYSSANHNSVRVEVRDNGCGIPNDMLPHVFKPYVTTKSGQHHGLGLWTIKKIIADHGGTIEVISKVNVGTIFAVDLPGTRTEEHSSAAQNSGN